MVTLVISIVTVALTIIVAVVWFALADSGEAGARADAQKLFQQSRQLLGAVEAYHTLRGEWPASMQTLLDARFLQEPPKAAAGNKVAWTMPADGVPALVLRGALKEAGCRAFNQYARQVDGITAKAYSGLRIQCYGNNDSDLRIVASAAGEDLARVLPPGHVLHGAPLVDRSAYGWFRAPSRASSAPQEPQPAQEPSAGGLVASGSELTFPATSAFQTANLETPLVLTNTSEDAIKLVRAVLQDTENFTIAAGDCTDTLEPGASCQLDVQFTPSRVGTMTSTLTITLAEDAQLELLLRGTALAPEIGVEAAVLGPLRLDKTVLDLPQTGAGVLTLTNTAEAGAALPLVEITDPAHFSVDASACQRALDATQLLPSGRSCELHFIFTPDSPGSYSATARLRLDGAERLVQLHGARAQPPVEAAVLAQPGITTRFRGVPTDRAPVDLGVQKEGVGRGGRFAPVAFEVQNTGNVPLVLESGEQLSGDAGFQLNEVPQSARNACARLRSLEPGQTCDVFVTYTLNKKAGTVRGVLEVVFRDVEQGTSARATVPAIAQTHGAWLTLTETESGTELNSGFRPGAGGWNFTEVGVGEGPVKRYMLRNRGIEAVTLKRVEINPLVIRPDSEASEACAPGKTLAPDEACPITLTFAPQVGQKSGERVPFTVLVQTEQPTAGEDPFSGAAPRSLGWTMFGWVR